MILHKSRLFYLLLIFLFVFFALPAKASLVGNANQATLMLNPQTGSYPVGQSFSVDIAVNTNNQPVNAVAAYINYNPGLFAVDAIDSTNSAFPIQWESSTTTPTGMIKIGRSIAGASVNSANAKIATIRLRGLTSTSPSSDNLTFDFTAGNANKSAVFLADAQGGTYILSGVYNGQYTITGGTTDTQAPAVNTFTIPSTSTSLTISITSFTATDNVGVAGYMVTESATAPSASASGWSTSIPTSYTFSSAGAKTLYAWAKDAAGNVSASKSATVTITTDNQAPTISSVSASSIGANSATITWTTDEASDSQIEYGTSASYGSATTLNSSMVTSHSQLLSGLSPSTTYHYRVKTKDAASNLATSADYTFTTTATSETLSVTLSANPSSGTAPLNGIDLSATVSGSATGNTNFTFYCNRTDNGTNVTSGYVAKYDNQTAATYNAPDLCDYSAAGTYTAKVIVERGSYQAESRTTISVAGVTPQNYLPVGSLDGADQNHVVGWAFDRDALTSPISVHIYIDGVNKASVTANLSRPDIIGANGGAVTDANHGFDYSLAGLNLASGSHIVKVYAINTPAGTNPELTGSPKTMPSPAPTYSNVQLLKSSDSDKIYMVVNSVKYWLTAPAVVLSYGFTSGSQQVISQSQLDNYPTGQNISDVSLPAGTLIRAKGDYKVWIILPPFKRHIFNPAVFGMYRHFTWASIKEVDQSVVDSYATSDLYRADTDYRVYSLQEIDEVNGIAIKHHLNLTTDQFAAKGYSWNQIFIVNAKERDYYQTGGDYIN